MSKEKEQNNQTPLSDLRDRALKHYEEASSSIHHWNSSIPQAIRYYFDERPKIEKRLQEYAEQQGEVDRDKIRKILLDEISTVQILGDGRVRLDCDLNISIMENVIEKYLKPQADKEEFECKECGKIIKQGDRCVAIDCIQVADKEQKIINP